MTLTRGIFLLFSGSSCDIVFSARLAEISDLYHPAIPLHCQMKNVSVVQWIGHSPTKPGIEVRVPTEIHNGVLADQVYAQD